MRVFQFRNMNPFVIKEKIITLVSLRLLSIPNIQSKAAPSRLAPIFNLGELLQTTFVYEFWN